MKVYSLIPLLLACGLWVQAQPAQAFISCNVSSPGFTSVYDPTIATANDTVSSATISCTRTDLINDANSVAYSLPGHNGLNATGQTNQAILVSLIKYDLYKDAAASLDWQPNRTFSGTISFGTGTSATLTIPYYARIPAGQTTVPAGIYADTVTMTLTYGTVTAPAATFSVQINTNAVCQISTLPGNVVFTYTSFQTAAALASTTFATRCTTGVTYTMSLDASSGTLLGLDYSLSLSATAGIGNGLPQTYSINGTVAANQAGSCATATCSLTAVRTLTITY